MKVLRWAIDVKAEKMDWLWYGWLPKGELTVIAGVQGDGKSIVLIDILARLSRGAEWPHSIAPPLWRDKYSHAPKARTLLFNAEDSTARTVVPRLMQAEADLSMVAIVEGIMLDNDPRVAFNVGDPAHLAWLDNTLTANPGIELVAFDPITSYVGNVNENSNVEVRRAITPLTELAAQHHVVIVGITHMRKAFGSALSRILGSTAWTAVPRSVVGISREDKMGYWVSIKSNLEANHSTLTFECEWSDDRIPRTVWTGTSEKTKDELMSFTQEGRAMITDRSSVVAKASVWLIEYMGSEAKLATDVFAVGEENGFSETCLKRAKKALGVLSERRGELWFWLPCQGGQTPLTHKHDSLDTVGPLEQGCQ